MYCLQSIKHKITWLRKRLISCLSTADFVIRELDLLHTLCLDINNGFSERKMCENEQKWVFANKVNKSVARCILDYSFVINYTKFK